MVQKYCEQVTQVPALEDRPPQLDRISPYDEIHLANYLRLLDSEAAGACWKEAVRIIFGIDPVIEPTRAKIVHESHLARALDTRTRLSSASRSAHATIRESFLTNWLQQQLT